MTRRACVGCLLACFAPALASAAPQKTEPTYKPESEATLTGTVTKLFTHLGNRQHPRQRATLKQADGTTIDIHIGPTSYIRDNGLLLKVGDQVTVTGSRVVEDNAPLVVVRRITRGKQFLDMRQADGRRLWPDRYR